MADVQTAEPRGKKKSKHRKKKRVNVRIDMTPMVDVMFLLLTFYMVTTAFSLPQTMEINLPPNDAQVDVAASNLMTLRVNAKGDIYWNLVRKPRQKSNGMISESLLTKKTKPTIA